MFMDSVAGVTNQSIYPELHILDNYILYAIKYCVISHGTRTYEIGVIHPHRHVVHIGLQISIQEGGVHSAPQHEGPTREQGEDTTAPAITIHIEYHAVLDCVVMRERIPVDS